MPTELENALALHRRGRLEQAARLYESILIREPANADALHLLGVLALQLREPSRAAELIGQAVALKPSAAAYHCNLAEAYRALGQTDRAAGCCRTALRLQPHYPEAANNLGLALLAQKKWPEAAAQFRGALQMKPDYALAASNLGVVLREQGDRAGARDRFQDALLLDPSLAHAHGNLAQILLEEGMPERALQHARESVRLRPDVAESHNNLGNVLRRQGQLTDARACFAEALRLNPDLAIACNNMARALQDEGRHREALTWHEQTARLQPDSAQFQCDWAGALEELEQFAEAIEHYRIAVALAPQRADLHNFLGHALQHESRPEEAHAQYCESLRLDPDYAAAHVNVGDLLEELGSLDEAKASFRAALRLNPRHAGALAQLATMLRDKLPDEDLSAIEAMLADPQTADPQRCRLHFGLAHVRDAQKGFAGAAEHLRQANALALAGRRKNGLEFDPASHVQFVDNLLAGFPLDFFRRLSGFGSESERPVFIIGLPRSGTTLVEQILASHSQVHGAGERRFARQTFESLPKVLRLDGDSFACLPGLDREVVARLAATHLGWLEELDGRAARVVDKMPFNYLYLGLIAVLFPRCRLIHCRRDLRDVAVSCWMTNFNAIRWANDPDHIACSFAQYRRAMSHWRQVLPIPWLDIDYEDTVADLEGVARKLIAWCGLNWEPACLAFHETKRPVRTASVTQVREPLYQRSVARWKNYEVDLGSLFEKLPRD